MIVDTSALVSILSEEIDGAHFAQLVRDASICRISAASLLELSMVIYHRGGPDALAECDNLISDAEIIIEPVTARHAYVARQAFLDYGKGRHPAGLNFGDCFAYALAKETGEALLFKGDDFRKTDILAATG